jgi:hypothetical protein
MKVTRRVDLKSKCEIVEFEDCFGSRHSVTIPLLSDIDIDQAIEQERAAHEGRELQFKQICERRNIVVPKDEKEKKADGVITVDPDCGCGS